MRRESDGNRKAGELGVNTVWLTYLFQAWTGKQLDPDKADSLKITLGDGANLVFDDLRVTNQA